MTNTDDYVIASLSRLFCTPGTNTIPVRVHAAYYSTIVKRTTSEIGNLQASVSPLDRMLLISHAWIIWGITRNEAVVGVRMI